MRNAVDARRVGARVLRPLLLVALCALVLVPRGIAFVSADDAVDPYAGAAVSSSRSGFTISGRVGGLFPGQGKSVRLRVTNPTSKAIKVMWISVRADKPAQPGCSVKALELPRKQRTSLRLPAGGRGTVLYPIRLRTSVPTTCQLARWPLRYVGEAKAVG